MDLGYVGSHRPSADGLFLCLCRYKLTLGQAHYAPAEPGLAYWYTYTAMRGPAGGGGDVFWMRMRQYTYVGIRAFGFEAPQTGWSVIFSLCM